MRTFHGDHFIKIQLVHWITLHSLIASLIRSVIIIVCIYFWEIAFKSNISLVIGCLVDFEWDCMSISIFIGNYGENKPVILDYFFIFACKRYNSCE